MDRTGKIWLDTLQKRWTFLSFLPDLLLSLAAGIFTAGVLKLLLVSQAWIAPVALLCVLVLLGYLHKFWQVSRPDVARYLNSRVPELQESAQLLLRPASSLSMLEQLQADRIGKLLGTIRQPAFPRGKIIRAAIALTAALLVASACYLLPSLHRSGSYPSPPAGSTSRTAETKPPAVAGLKLRLTPPAYTGQREKEQSAFSISAIEGSVAEWTVTTTQPVEALSLLFNDKEPAAMHPANKERTEWTFRRTLASAGFYQLKVPGRLSELYMIDLQTDQLPQIRIVSPRQYTTVELGAPKQVPLRAVLSDDFGLRNTYITATIASGSGEAVRFKEQRLPFPDFSAGRERNVQKLLRLDQMGMKPGDELYYYVSAIDNQGQENRSDIYILTLPDTAQLFEIDGLTNAVNLKVEYFRSQRQIIIETEQLLKDRDTLSAGRFNTKSNNLGIDQKLLRLRYGKFLGEETDEEIGGHHDDRGDEHDETVFGDPSKIIDQFTHKHDNAEDATFFEPKLKEQLKATLSEMWKAELQLRLFKPQEALQYEYKALLLLKDLQQQSRSYVAKASYKTTPLKPEKRLTGDLSKIGQPLSLQKQPATHAGEAVLRQAAGLLEDLKQRQSLSPAGRKVLQAAARQLGQQAAAKPTVYLASFDAMKRVLQQSETAAPIPVQDIGLAEKGLQALISPSPETPGAEQTGVRQQLSQQYFKNLSHH